MSSQKKKSGRNNSVKSFNYYLIPLLLIIFIVPLITRLYIYDSGLSIFPWFGNSTREYDLFLYWKSRVFIILTGVTLVFFAYAFIKRHISLSKKDFWVIPLAGYGILTLISTLASEYRKFGFNGIYEQFESVWVVLSYCVTAFYAYKVIISFNDITFIKKALFLLLAVMCLLGITQFAGMDFFESSIGRRMIVPEKYAALRDILTFNFSGTGTHQVYLTLYNPNYVGVFASLVLPVTVIFIFSSDTLKKKLCWGIISILLLLCTLGSGSRTFIISFAAVILFAMVFYRKLLIKHIKLVIPVTAAALICCAGYFAFAGTNPVNYIKSAFNIQKNDYKLEDVEMTDNAAVFTYNGTKLYVSYLSVADQLFYSFKDDDGTALETYSDQNGNICLSDSRFEGIRFTSYGQSGGSHIAIAVVNNTDINFVKTEDGYSFVSPTGKFDTIVHAETALLTNYDSLASGRGYLWSRTIPLLKKHLLLGSGADTFIMTFPQNDYIGRVNAGYTYQYITRPHNLYLQIGVQHGVAALICFLAVCVIYLVQSICLYWKSDFSNRHHLLGTGIMLGITGYLVSGITNDSMVTFAPVFWILLGTGYAVNRLNRENTD